jgi:formylglycine-generating enzyme required for sulfatase activity
VSDFRLDRFEITVGRFRKFLASYPGDQPQAGAGAHPLIADSGWQVEWNSSLALDQAALKMLVNCKSAAQTWTDAVGGNENKPLDCIDWYEAFAFCAWDGGRMPTEAEWNYAAAGGDEQRQYPWSIPPSSITIDSTLAIYGGTSIAAVGSKSMKGDGRWGQADLAGNVWEWTLDWFSAPYPGKMCDDCANVSPGNTPDRVARGGSWYDSPSEQLTSGRNHYGPSSHGGNVGARCARAR